MYIHINEVNLDTKDKTKRCEECEKIDSDWVHLCLCLFCGYVECCDSSVNKHGTKPFQESGHPIIKSYEPGENWKRCYEDLYKIRYRKSSELDW